MGRSDVGSHGKEPGQLRSTQLSQAIERLHTGVRVDLDEAELASAIVATEPVQQLQQLQLVIEIVLKPQNNFVVLAGVLQRPVARSESRPDLLIVAPAKAGQRLRTDVREFAQRRGLRDR